VAASGADGAYTTIAAAITASANGDTIHIVESPHTESGITINKNVTIKGDGPDKTIVQAHANPDEATDRIFGIPANNSYTIALEDMTLRHGRTTGAGGALFVGNWGNKVITILRCAFVRNSSTGTGGGGAVYVGYDNGAGKLMVFDSVFVSNSWEHATGEVGGAAIKANSGVTEVIVQNSTFAYNHSYANWTRGGALQFSPAEGESAIIRNCTFVGNSVATFSSSQTRPKGGAIYGNNSGRVSVVSSVFQDNYAGDGVGEGNDLYGCSYSYCVYAEAIEGADGGDNIITADAMVDTVLRDNGGPTPTMALLAGSPAINAGSNPGGLPYDQRGEPFERVVGAAADCGAYEFRAGLPTQTVIILR
jgi:hypothetical protein